MNGSQLLYRVNEAMETLRIGRTSLYGLIGSGQIKTVRIGRAVRIPAAELERWLETLRSSEHE